MKTYNSTYSIGYAIDLRKRLFISVVLVLSCLMPGISNSAITATGTLTADNHYALYTGNATGTYINMIGRNEYGPEGDDDGTNWASPETWSFILNPGDYIYIFAWDVGPPEMVVATFSHSGNVLSTNTNDWLVTITNVQNC